MTKKTVHLKKKKATGNAAENLITGPQIINFTSIFVIIFDY